MRSDAWQMADLFAAAYKVWARLRNARHQAGTVSYPEMLAWQRAKSAWRDTERGMDREYRGER
jgi:hypothetical protein